ncbi:hypothetical protein BUE80_DR009369 [Diplocarpon rosae]|nr:hypothetical protein BUE80_DR009369 [Diplocarpon rosae]
MNSAFGSKRKARKIQVDEDEVEINKGLNTPDEISIASPGNSNLLVDSRKYHKKSSLRQSLALDDEPQDGDHSSGPQVESKPTIGRPNYLMNLKKSRVSKLSFGPSEIISGDAAEALEDNEVFTPKKAIRGRLIADGNTKRRNVPFRGLPMRTNDDDDERPTYSKDYLNELRSSTPNTPKVLTAPHTTASDEGLEASELEGAMIVDTEDILGSASSAFIPSEAEIREKKERRARLAKERDFISFNDDDGQHIQSKSLLPRNNKEETRLVREDEDLGEGFDEFVDDGRISLGKKQEREERKRRKKEMADMIHQAEGSSDGDSDGESDSSEAERRAAYEAAQTRAGMDGLHKSDQNVGASAAQIPSKITPMPVLSECLTRLQMTLSSMEQNLAQRYRQMEALKQEENEIAAREIEVQELLKQAGARYAALKSDANGAVPDSQTLTAQANEGFAVPMIIDRGLESFGNTPTVRPDVEDVG